jgi:hypothetical protein
MVVTSYIGIAIGIIAEPQSAAVFGVYPDGEKGESQYE